MTRFESRGILAALAALLLAGCGGDAAENQGAELSMDTTAAAAGPEGVAASSDALQASTPDHQFLQQMSDHHVGLVQWSQQAQQKAPQDTVKKEARHFLAGHQNDLQQMQNMLQQQFNDSHQPTIMPKHAAVADTLTQHQGPEYGRAYVQHVIDHHKAGVQMIDEYLARATDQNVKVMAEKMKTVQQDDIKRLEGLLAQL